MTTDTDALHLPSRRLTSPAALERYREHVLGRPSAETTVHVCMTTGCRAGGAESVHHAFERELEHRGLRGSVALRPTGCRGFCARGPVVVVEPQGVFYEMVEPGDVPDIVARTVVRGEVVSRLTLPRRRRLRLRHHARHPVLRRAAARRPAQLREHRPDRHRRLHRPRRVRGPGEDPRAGCRPPRSSRRSSRAACAAAAAAASRRAIKWELAAAAGQRREVRRLQRRRGRPGRVHGPRHPRGRPARRRSRA